MPQISWNLHELEPGVKTAAQNLLENNTIQRLWNSDHSIWRTEEIHKKSILSRLGWLRSVDLMRKNLSTLRQFGDEVSAEFTHVVVLGMGGSSLCPDVCRSTFGSAPKFPRLFVLDSTSPASVLRVEKQIDLTKTLFIVASKSGGTTETNMFYQYFFHRVTELKGHDAGKNFVAITDADTKMERIATEKGFRRIFLNPADIGGRYSALSYFGLVPMACIGMDLQQIIDSASAAMASSQIQSLPENEATYLGLALGAAYGQHREKLTFIASKDISTFSFWIEQLVAESTGKEGKGILPVEGESLNTSLVCRSEKRLYILYQTKSHMNELDGIRQSLSKSVLPWIQITLDDVYDLGGEFFRWEFATAIASSMMAINPFDEPNVKESKDNTVQAIEGYVKTGSLPPSPIIARDEKITLYAEESHLQKLGGVGKRCHDLLAAHLGLCREEDYLAILAYIDQNEENQALLAMIRDRWSSIAKCPSTLGFGPRYLHSTGQLHKGGKPNGVFVILTGDEEVDVPIEGEQFTFGVLKSAQAFGDYRSFANRDTRMIRIHLNGNNLEALRYLTTILP